MKYLIFSVVKGCTLIIKHKITTDLICRDCNPILNLSQGDTGDFIVWNPEFAVTQDMIDISASYYIMTVHKNNVDTMMMVKDRGYPDEYIIPPAYCDSIFQVLYFPYNQKEGRPNGHPSF